MADQTAYKTLCDNLSASTDLKELWTLFKHEHDRNYDAAADAEHYEHFVKNAHAVIAHNEQFKLGQTTFRQCINKFTDLSPEEMKVYYGGRR